MSLTQTHPTAMPEDQAGPSFRTLALTVSTSVWTWAEAANLPTGDGNVLLALAEAKGDAGASDISTRAGLPVEVVYPALHRLTDRGYVREEHRRHRLTDAGRGLVAEFDRAGQTLARGFGADRLITPEKGMS